MSNIIQQLDAETMAGKVIPDFRPGDTVEVKVKVKEEEQKDVVDLRQ